MHCPAAAIDPTNVSAMLLPHHNNTNFQSQSSFEIGPASGLKASKSLKVTQSPSLSFSAFLCLCISDFSWWSGPASASQKTWLQWRLESPSCPNRLSTFLCPPCQGPWCGSTALDSKKAQAMETYQDWLRNVPYADPSTPNSDQPMINQPCSHWTWGDHHTAREAPLWS